MERRIGNSHTEWLEVVNLTGRQPQAIPLSRESLEVLDIRGDPAVEWIATVQNGAIAYWQLRAVGLSERMIRHRIDTHALNGVFRGVFLAGHVATNEHSLPTAGLLAAGLGSHLSFHTAGALDGFAKRIEGIVDVTVPGAERRSRKGLRFHSRALHPGETLRVDGLPMTSPARTVVDLASVMPLSDIPKLIGRAMRATGVTRAEILEAATNAGRTRNIGAIRHALSVPANYEKARSDAEVKLFALLRSANLPLPESNENVNGKEFDFVWHPQKLIAEYDSYQFHFAPDTFAKDREKSNAALAAGYATLRFTDDHLSTKRHEFIATIAAQLARRLAA